VSEVAFNPSANKACDDDTASSAHEAVPSNEPVILGAFIEPVTSRLPRWESEPEKEMIAFGIFYICCFRNI
jgi:hypothetical protein